MLKCQICHTARSRGTQVTGKSKPDNALGIILADVNAKLVMLMPLVEKVDSLLEMRKTVNNIEQSVQLMSEKYDELLEKTNRQEKKM